MYITSVGHFVFFLSIPRVPFSLCRLGFHCCCITKRCHKDTLPFYNSSFNFAGIFSFHSIVCNGNRTEWSPIRSVIIRVITKSEDRAAGVRFLYHEYQLQTELDDTKSYYQLIIKIALSEKRKMGKLCENGKIYIKKLTI